VDRITDAFVWPVRDPKWLTKILIIALTLVIPIVGAINAIGWMLASLDLLRAGDERLAPANLGHLGRGIRLFTVNIVYALAIGLVVAVIYVPGLWIASRESQGAASAGLISLSIALSLLAFSIATLGSVVLNFLTPSIVLATDRGGIAGGLAAGSVLRHARSNLASTLIAGLMLIAAGFVGSVGLIACGIGVLFTTAYSLAMQAWVVRSFEIGSPAGEAA
jgi:Protein of unknown function (DUF4013)